MMELYIVFDGFDLHLIKAGVLIVEMLPNHTLIYLNNYRNVKIFDFKRYYTIKEIRFPLSINDIRAKFKLL